MQGKKCLVLIAILVCCCVHAQLLLKPPKNKPNIVAALNEYMSGVKKLDISTSCSVVNLPEHNGVTRSGYLNVGVKDSKSALGFIFYGALGVTAEDLKNRPTIIWLNGGPGCSSQFGNFYELGPLYVNQTSTGQFVFTQNTHAWSNEFNTIFVDQPIGTGISYAESSSDIPTNMDGVAEQFSHALNELYNSPDGCFNQLGLNANDTPLFLYGESYAGKYTPSIAAALVQAGNKFNLRGIGIGDGFTVPYYVVGALSPFAHINGLTNAAQFARGEKVAKQTQDAINKGLYSIARNGFNEDMTINNPKNLDVYNIQRKAEPDSSALDNLFNSAFGQNLFNLKAKAYAQCDNTVYAKFANDFMKGDSIKKVEYLLEQNFQVSVFNGNLDLIVPYNGTEDWLAVLNWTHADEFNAAQTTPWTSSEGAVYGTKKSFKNLEYRNVYNSGHMVPQDQPAAALNLITSDVNKALNKKSVAATD